MLQILLLAFVDIFFIYSTIRFGGEMGGYIWLSIGGIIWMTATLIFAIKNWCK